MTKDTRANEIDEIDRGSVFSTQAVQCLALSVCSDPSTEHSPGLPADGALISSHLFQTDTVDLEGTSVPDGQLSQLQINSGKWGCGQEG